MGGRGGNVGGANFEITGSEGSPSVEDVLRKQIAAVKAASDAANRAFGKPVEFIDPKSGALLQVTVTRAVALLKGLERELADLNKIAAHVELLPDVSALRERTVKAIVDVKTQLGTIKPTAINDLTRALFDESKAAEAARRAQEQLGKTTADTINAANPQAFKNHQIAFQDVTLAASGLARETSKGEVATTSLGRAFQGITGKLKDLGLNTRAVSILLGAGLAGGIAGVIRITEKLVRELNAITAAEKELERQTALTFGGGSDQVSEFVANQAKAFGESIATLQEVVNSYGVFAIQLGLTGKAVTDFGETFGTLAELVSKVTPGVSDLAGAQALIKSAISGNLEAIHQLGFSTEEFARLARENFGVGIDKLTDLERAAILAGDGLDTLNTKAAKVKIDPNIAAIHQITDTLKQALADAFGATEKVLGAALLVLATDTQVILNSLIHGLNVIVHGINAAVRTANALNPFADIPTVPTIPTIPDSAIPGLDAFTQAQEGANKAMADGTKTVKELTAAQKEKAKQDFIASDTLQNQFIDAVNAVTDAQVNGAKAVEEAQLRLQRVREDVLQKSIDLAIRNARASEDAAHRIKEAEINLKNVREKARRSEEDSLNKIADIRLQHQRKQEDLQKRIKDAKEKEVQDLLHAQLSLFEAEVKGTDVFALNRARLAVTEARTSGTKAVQNAEEELQREREDNIKALNRAEIERTRAQVDAREAVRKANDELEQAQIAAQRAHEDAVRSLNALEVENNRALHDAQKAVTDSQDAMEKAINKANKALSDLATTLRLTVIELKDIVASLQGIKDLTQVPFVPGSTFAAGGDLPFGKVGLAGEHGRELIIGGRSGSSILPHDLTEKLLALLKGDGGGRVNQNIHVTQVANDPEATAFAVAARLVRGIG